MATNTANYGLVKPAVNSATDSDLWGGELNGDMDSLDGLLLKAFNFIKSNNAANFSVTAPTSGSTNTGDSHKLFRCDATTGAIAANLPSATSAGNGFTVAFKKLDATNNVTITANGGDLIDGAATFVLSNQYNWAILVSDGVTEWDIISDTASTAGLAPLDSPAFIGTPTAPTAAASANTTQLSTTAQVQSAILGGVGQAWTDVTGSRTLGSTYTNSTGRPIMVFANPGGHASSNVAALIGGVAIGTFTADGTGLQIPLSFVVPDGITYSITNAGGSLVSWWELR